MATVLKALGVAIPLLRPQGVYFAARDFVREDTVTLQQAGQGLIWVRRPFPECSPVPVIGTRASVAVPNGITIHFVQSADVSPEVARLRHQFANRIESLDQAAWETPSWCSGWQVRDVLAHLVNGAESTPWSLITDLVRGGFRPDYSVNKATKRLRDVAVPELADRLRRAADRCLRSGTSKPFGMGDVVVHSADALRPLGEDVDVAPEMAAAVLDAYWDRARIVVHGAPHRRRRLVATDLDWARGSGPEVMGRTIDLLLLVANRRQVLPSLEGPGLADV